MFVCPLLSPVRSLCFHLFNVLNGAEGPGLGCVVCKICSFLKYSRRGSDLPYCLYLFISLFISLSWQCTFLVMLMWDLPGPCHQYPKSSTVVISLYHWSHVQLLTVAFFHAQAEVIMSTQLWCLYLLEFTQCANCHVLFNINMELCLPAHIFFLLASPVFTFFSPPMWALVICYGWVSVGAQHPCE